MTTTTTCRWAATAVALASVLASCSGDSESHAELPSPVAYTAKVKNLLTGLPPTDQEAETALANPSALPGLIDTWMETPEFRQKMLEFFKQAFQQTQIGFLQFEDQIGGKLPGLTPAVTARLVRSAEMSFPFTAMQLVDEGRPFTETVATERFVLNPPLMALLAYLDNVTIDDDAVTSSTLVSKYGNALQFVLHYDDTTSVPFEASIDPKSPHFLHFYEPCPRKNGIPKCEVIELKQPTRVDQALLTYLFNQKFTEADWNDWHMVQVRPPSPAEEASMYWSLPDFRSKRELVLNVPRVGFMTTPAFFANWPTNASNLARVTINQTLIVGLGYSIASSEATPVSETGKPDAQHSAPGTTCFACHQTLDPMRNFVRQSFSVTYHRQTQELKPEQQVAKFVLDDTVAGGTGVRDLAAIVAQHPRFAPAWVQKLCHYASSSPCLDSDPEFVRVTNVFRDAHYDFKSLVRELFSSPLVTSAVPTASYPEPPATIARRDHFCAALQNRLGLADVCELNATAPTPIQNLAFGVPGASYARGVATPLLPREPNLFFTSAVENLCQRMAERAVDPPACLPGQRCFSSADPEAIRDLVRIVMAIPPLDARFDDVRNILTEHHDEAVKAGYSATDALRSTFVLACTSPSSSAMGL
ncbi:hypothetical protein [Pendulispora albinea]|uniref:Uncharacterized protein n=1 Tax=Pendulispora albinea TaxID=2741071 RepID=A0ABZ2LY52_9BACT